MRRDAVCWSISLIVMFLLAVLPGAANAAMVSFTGSLVSVEEDDGIGLFIGASVVQMFSGFVRYGNSVADATGIDGDDAESSYDFFAPEYNASLFSGAITQPGTNVTINIQNSHVLDADEAALASVIAGMTIDPGTAVDVWTAAAFEPGASEADPTPGDMSDEEILFSGGRLEVIFLSLDAELYDDASFRAIPPALGDQVFGAFLIDEADDLGNTLFSAFGTINGASAVPVPAAA